MATLANSANLTRPILLFSGTALILIGFYGIVEDYIHNWRIEEYSSLAALLSGSAILLATTLVYVIIPGYQSRQRIGILRHYYMGRPRGEIKDINHNIIERAQGIIAGAEMLAELVHECSRENVTDEECKNKVTGAREMLEFVRTESSRLNDLLDRMDDYISVKKQLER